MWHFVNLLVLNCIIISSSARILLAFSTSILFIHTLIFIYSLVFSYMRLLGWFAFDITPGFFLYYSACLSY